MKQGFTSIQVEKSSLSKACFANKWAGLLPSMQTFNIYIYIWNSEEWFILESVLGCSKLCHL